MVGWGAGALGEDIGRKLEWWHSTETIISYEVSVNPRSRSVRVVGARCQVCARHFTAIISFPPHNTATGNQSLSRPLL
jgi:hypothetical protein